MLNASLLPVVGGRFRLRPLTHADAEAYAAGAADPLVRLYGHLPEPEYTPASVRRLIDEVLDPTLARGELAVLALTTADDHFAGSVVLFDVTATSAEIGFWMHPHHRGGGGAGAALALAAEFAARSGLRTLTARTAMDNTASQRVLERGGFRERERRTELAPSGESLALILCGRDLGSESDGA